MGVFVSKQNGGANPFKPNKVSGNGNKSLGQAAAESNGNGTSVHLFDFSGALFIQFNHCFLNLDF